MTLYDICQEVAIVEQQLMEGDIEFAFDPLMSAMKPGHPADLLDEVLSKIGWDVFAGKDVSLDRVKEWHKELKQFKSTFKIKALDRPIKHVKAYIEKQEEKENADSRLL